MTDIEKPEYHGTLDSPVMERSGMDAMPELIRTAIAKHASAVQGRGAEALYRTLISIFENRYAQHLEQTGVGNVTWHDAIHEYRLLSADMGLIDNQGRSRKDNAFLALAEKRSDFSVIMDDTDKHVRWVDFGPLHDKMQASFFSAMCADIVGGMQELQASQMAASEAHGK